MSDAPRPPADQLAWLVPADVRDGRTDRGAQAGRVWDGVVWSRLGRGDLAWACWNEVEDSVLAPWVQAERGRVLRELGLHERAQEHDVAGLRGATDPIDEAMLWIGLTADAVGRALPEEVAVALGAARDAVDAAPPGPRRDRQLLRLTWVETEAAALVGNEPPAGPWPALASDGPSFPELFASGTDFHRAKACLFRGVLDADPRMLAAARRLAPPVLVWAIELARADLGEDGALADAAEAWAVLAPPLHVADEVGAGSVARRLAGAPPADGGAG